MKHMKKLGSLLLALVLALALAVPALAAENHAKFVAPSNGTATKYELFKVMGAELDGNSLRNFSWPTGTSAHFYKDGFIAGMQNLSGDGEAVAAAKAQFSTLSGTSSDEDIARALDKLRNDYPNEAGELVAGVLNSTGVRTTADPWEIGTPLEPGYYMVLATFPDGTTRSSLYNVLGNEGNIEIKEKPSTLPPTTPEAFKKVQDSDDPTKWVDATDYPEGQTFQFQLSTPIKGYTSGNNVTHPIVLHDQMNASQLKVPAQGDIKAVYIIHKNDDGTEKRADITHYTFETGALDSCANKGTTCAFHVSFDAAAAQFPDGSGIQNGDMIYVEYDSQLLPGANVGTIGNKNGVWAETPSGPSEIVEVTVYTFTLVANKVDGGNNNTPLYGATFQLSKQDANGSWVPVGEEIGTPVRVNAEGKPIDNQGNPVAEGGPLWYVVKGEDGTETYTTDTAQAIATFNFSKLGEGKYKLEEVKYPMTPDGKTYNQAGPYFFEVTATYNKDAAGNNVSLAKITVTVQDQNGNAISQNKPIELGVGTDGGTISTEIVNNTGFQMPETGGIGTTIFYIVGGILAAGAVILLITKRRMRVEEE